MFDLANNGSMKLIQRTGMWILVGVGLVGLQPKGVPQTNGDSAGLLPTVTQVKEWAQKGTPKRLTGEQVYDYMDGAGEIPIACGYRTLLVAEYAGKSGAVATIELYDMGNSGDAFGLYSMKRLSTGRVVPLGTEHAPVQAQAGFNELLLHKGRYTILVYGDASGKVKDGDLLTLGTTVLKNIKEGGALPDLLKSLPSEGCVPRTVKYFHGKAAMDTVKFIRDDVFRLKAKPDVSVATYANPTGKLMVVRYGTKDEATQALASAQQARDCKTMTFVQEGKLLGAAWTTTGKPADPVLVKRLAEALRKPGKGAEIF